MNADLSISKITLLRCGVISVTLIQEEKMNLSCRLKILITGLTACVLLAAIMFPRTNAAGAMVQDIASVYKTKCASCHAADGSGNTAYGKKEKLRDLRSADVQKQTDAQLLALVAKGKGKMPGYEKSLGGDKCNQLVAHIRKLGGR